VASDSLFHKGERDVPVSTIFLIDRNDQITEMKDQPYDFEGRLQSFLAKPPSVVAGDPVND